MIGTHINRYSGESRRMDDHNNAIGLLIGAEAKSYDEVVRRARAAIDAGIGQNGTGRDATPLWFRGDGTEPRERPRLERGFPVTWPATIPSAPGYRFGDERFNADRALRAGTPRQREAALLERLESTPYRNPAAPGHATWRDRVRQYFAERNQGSDRDCGGVAAVRAHTRMGPSGHPIEVSAHTRGMPCG